MFTANVTTTGTAEDFRVTVSGSRPLTVSEMPDLVIVTDDPIGEWHPSSFTVAGDRTSFQLHYADMPENADGVLTIPDYLEAARSSQGGFFRYGEFDVHIPA